MARFSEAHNVGQLVAPESSLRSREGLPRGKGFWRQVARDWERLHGACRDRASQRRLQHLQRRLASSHAGARESAIAELDVAAKIHRAGGSVQFLPESVARSADLECWFGDERLFIEVTTMIGASKRPHGVARHRAAFQHEPEGDFTVGDLLINRILARIGQKARQLSDYCAPVLLAVHVRQALDGREQDRPGRFEGGTRSHSLVPLDLRRLAGAVTSLLLPLHHLSGVLLALWDVEALPAPSSVRLANVEIAERAGGDARHPIHRVCVLNPESRFQVGEWGRHSLRALL
ncbi:MAG TPA: hypothetical protein VLA99_10975 [Nitrospiraceae bacterium]|nr:hypothetical protein [Nitrospiraceae bacterium]